MADQASDKVKKAMKDLSNNVSRSKGNGNRQDPGDTKTGSDAQHGQTDAAKAEKKSNPNLAKKK